MSAMIGMALGLIAFMPAENIYAEEPANGTKTPLRTEDIVSAPYIPTPHDVVDKMLDLAAITKDDVVYDLGCGDGRIVVAAAKKYGCHAVGIDIDPNRVNESNANVAKNHVEDLVQIECIDFRKVDLRKATVVTLYLSTILNSELLPQLKTMKPGSRIVSHEFGIQWLPPDKMLHIDSKEDHRRHILSLWILK
jgi:SAM-dependent methyltransferase